LLYQQQKIQQTERGLNNTEKAETKTVLCVSYDSFCRMLFFIVCFRLPSPQPRHRGSAGFFWLFFLAVEKK
jgi:hypothetical protein